MNTPTSTKAIHASLTSFSQLFGRNIQGQTIRQIEIPPIQRDYAQGRRTEQVDRIRHNFIDALCKALLPNERAIDLDFVFGDVEQEGDHQGKFCPLDGQQRLTTLFLLHCYLAWRTGIRPLDQAWSRFTYSTRPGTRDCCHFLTRCQPDFAGPLSAWIKDHADYLATWHHDPSIQSMLVVLDALHSWFDAWQPDFEVAWTRLVSEETPAIRFHLLPMKAHGLSAETTYIKMNSRGKPLTSFENFKAHFEDMLKKVHPDKEKEFAHKVDTDWSNILWPYRGEDHLVDDEFMCYFRCITEISAWRIGNTFGDNVRADDLAEQVYGAAATNAADNLKFLFQAWDVFKGKNVKTQFEAILTRQRGSASVPLLIFNPFDKENVDLFHACCAHYGTHSWTLAHTLLFYGVLLSFIHQVEKSDASSRLRILRNLVEASEDEIRAGERNNMPKLLIEVEQIVVYGDLQQVSTFNQVQVKNEGAKAALLQAMPTMAADLHRLEDHDLLRGGLTAFDLDPKTFASRARAFISIFDKAAGSFAFPWMGITGALLAKGDYSRQGPRWTGHRWANFGAPKNDEPWQVLFRGKKGEAAHPAAEQLRALLDAIATGSTLQTVIDTYLDADSTPKDWRYYFVKYNNMREGASGRYTISKSGYQVCMLDKERMTSDYYDPYLFAAAQLGGVFADGILNAKWPRCFTSDEINPRKLVLRNSGLQIECVDQGWKISGIPTDPAHKLSFDRKSAAIGIDENCLCTVPQKDGIDTVDRVELGAKLLVGLITINTEKSSH